MVKPRRRYAVIAAVCFFATFVVDTIAKLDYLGDASATFDILVNIVLIAAGLTAAFLGIRHDRQVKASSKDNDY